MRMFTQLLSILILPTFIYGLQCDYGGQCYGLKLNPLPDDHFATKTCTDACVFYRCLFWEENSNSTAVMEGAGCYEDFVNACKWIPTKYKDQIKASPKDEYILKDDFTFYSCTHEKKCASNRILFMQTEERFGLPGIRKPRPEDVKCKYDNAPKAFSSMSKCGNKISCRPASNYLTYPSYTKGDDKECDACLEFECSNDGGNTLIAGSGCFEDFVHACPSVPSDVKENIKRNINDSFYYDKNYMVTSCSYQVDGGCYSKYDKSNFWLKNSVVEANLNKTYSENCTAELLPHIQTSTGETSHANAYYFGGILITVFKLIFMYLW